MPTRRQLNLGFSYDGYERLQNITDSTGSSSRSFDDDGDITQVLTTYTGLPQKSISYTFNPDGSRASMVTPAGSFTYGYENDGRPSSETNPYSETTQWSYLDNGWLWKQVLGNGPGGTNGTTASLTYNAAGMVTRLQNITSASVTLSDFGGTGGLRYDGVGNLISQPCSVPASSAATGTSNWTYNTADELTQEQSGRNAGYTENFGYDAAFNPTTWKGAAQAFNTDNQNTAFTFDGNGNPTAYKGTTAGWDAENRLTSFGTVLTAGYNAGNLRAWKQNQAGTRTYFLYDGADPVIEMDSGGNVTAVNTFGAEGLVSRHTPAGSVFYTFDPQGNVVQRLDSSQNVLSTLVYDGFGTLLSGTQTEPWGYNGQSGYYTDTETGLILCTFRYYDPTQGRWLNRDPIGQAGGINLYGYVGNGPVGAMDPSGRGIGPQAIGTGALAAARACAVGVNLMGAKLPPPEPLVPNATAYPAVTRPKSEGTCDAGERDLATRDMLEHNDGPHPAPGSAQEGGEVGPEMAEGASETTCGTSAAEIGFGTDVAGGAAEVGIGSVAPPVVGAALFASYARTVCNTVNGWMHDIANGVVDLSNQYPYTAPGSHWP